MTSKLFYIYSVYKNYQILSLQLSSISRVSQTISNKLINTHDFLVSRNNCSYFSCYLFCRLSLIILENVSITFRVTTEWLHFRPYIHPIDHHFTKKKKNLGGFGPTRASSSTPCGLNPFWLCQKPMHPYFFGLPPGRSVKGAITEMTFIWLWQLI